MWLMFASLQGEAPALFGGSQGARAINNAMVEALGNLAEYEGQLKQDSGPDRTVVLRLEVKDIPSPVEGSVDPVMTPILTGYLKFVLGSDPNEFVGFGIQKAEFDPKQNKVDLVANHPDFKDMIFSLVRKDGQLQGRWTAPALATSGNVVFKKTTGPATVTSALSGTYQGTVKNTNPASNLPERALVSLVTSKDPLQPNSIKVTGNMRLYLGDFGSLEYTELPFTEVTHNYFTNKLVAKTGGDIRLTLKAEIIGSTLKGVLFADGLGEVADIEVKKP